MQTLILSDEEAARFLEWQANREVFQQLVDSGVFIIKNGSAELHFDSLGRLASIDAKLKLYRREAKILTTVRVQKS